MELIGPSTFNLLLAHPLKIQKFRSGIIDFLKDEFILTIGMCYLT